MDLKAKNITSVSKGKRKIREIYHASFAKEERMPFWLMVLLANTKNTELVSFYDQQMLCGFIYMATIKELTFIMFFAVDENIRSKGYGSCILDKVHTMHSHNKLIVSIERCEEDTKDFEQQVRRKTFYMNNGYAETGYLIELENKKQELLIKNGTFDKEEFALFFKKYSNGTVRPKIEKTRNT